MSSGRLLTLSELWLGMRSAFSLLTIIPVGFGPDEQPSNRLAVPFFPLVGLVVGLGIYLVSRILPVEYPELSSVVMVLVGIVLTRGFHWDGLADVGDAWWGGHTPERRREIMSDTRVGTFGVLALIVAALAIHWLYVEAISFGALPLVVVAVTVSRTSAVFGSLLGDSAKPQGLGASTVARGGAEHWIIAGLFIMVALAVAVGTAGLGIIPWFALAVFIAAVIPHLISRHMGGVTGDVLGASIVLTEVAALAILLVCPYW